MFKAKVSNFSRNFEKKEQAAKATWLSDRRRIAKIIAILAIIIAIIMAITTLFGGSWTSNILNPWMLVIVSSVIAMVAVNFSWGKSDLEPVKRVAVLFLVIAIIGFIASKVWPAIGSKIFDKSSSSPTAESYGYGEYQLALATGEESKWITFKPNMRFKYSISLKECSSDSLMVVYSNGDTINVWDEVSRSKMSLHKNDRNPRFKLISLGNLEKIRIKVKKS